MSQRLGDRDFLETVIVTLRYFVCDEEGKRVEDENVPEVNTYSAVFKGLERCRGKPELQVKIYSD